MNLSLALRCGGNDGFAAEQVKALARKLNPKHTRECLQDRQTLSYIEGWHALAGANRIYCFECSDRESVSLKRRR